MERIFPEWRRLSDVPIAVPSTDALKKSSWCHTPVTQTVRSAATCWSLGWKKPTFPSSSWSNVRMERRNEAATCRRQDGSSWANESRLGNWRGPTDRFTGTVILSARNSCAFALCAPAGQAAHPRQHPKNDRSRRERYGAVIIPNKACEAKGRTGHGPPSGMPISSARGGVPPSRSSKLTLAAATSLGSAFAAEA